VTSTSLSFSVQTPSGSTQFEVPLGTSLYFVGANGSGKTRLGVYIENFGGERVQRVSAHRTLTLNPKVAKISEADARKGLKIGNHHQGVVFGQRNAYRWQEKQATALLNDYDFMLQMLFANQSNISLQTHNSLRKGVSSEPEYTRLETLDSIWNRLLPHRSLHISGDDIQVSQKSERGQYSAQELSDGERAIFYLVGQTLVADPNSLLIFDEPELHIHRSVLSRLWDELEAARQDCGFIVISHDLDFVASRQGQKFVLKSYDPNTGWQIETVPKGAGFPEDITTLILGSRKPVLFVEGKEESLDLAVYRCCFPDWTIIPSGSCEQVIHSVSTMRAHAALTRVTCAGVVDADSFSEEEAEILKTKGISVLSVSEIENLFVLPELIEQLLLDEGHQGAELNAKKERLIDNIVDFAANEKNRQECVLRYCRRRIDRTMKKIDLSDAKSPSEISTEFTKRTSELDVLEMAKLANDAIGEAIASRDLVKLLRWFDNKGLLAIVAQTRSQNKAAFEQWIIRTLNNKNKPGISEALARYLPNPIPQ
jgi:hypothetical protein